MHFFPVYKREKNANSFFSQLTSIEEGGKVNDRIASLERISIHPKLKYTRY